MGAYLSQPVTTKLLDKCENDTLGCGVAAMQGWRREMEDAHLCEVDVVPQRSLFGVFDGHGGREVALFVARHLANELRRVPDFQKGDLSLALKQGFLMMDQKIASIDAREELQRLSVAMPSNSNEADKGLGDVIDQLSSEDNIEAHAGEEKSPIGLESSAGGDVSSFPIQMDTMLFDTDSEEEDLDGGGKYKSTCGRRTKSLTARIFCFLFPFQCLQPNRFPLFKEKRKQREQQRAQAIAHRVDSFREDYPYDDTSNSLGYYDDIPNADNDWEEDGSSTMMAGCTAVVALITNDMLYVANAGDSRCVLCRNGIAFPMSRDHKPTNPDEFSRIAGGFVIEGRVQGCLNLSRAFGDLEFKEPKAFPPERQIVTADPEIQKVQLRKDDHFVLLACDGIWDVLSCQEACDFVSKRLKQGVELHFICSKLCDFCLADDSSGSGEGCDNMTAMIILLKQFTSL